MALPEITPKRYTAEVQDLVDMSFVSFEHRAVPEGERQNFIIRLNRHRYNGGKDIWRASSGIISEDVNKIVFGDLHVLTLGGYADVSECDPTQRHLRINEHIFEGALEKPVQVDLEDSYSTRVRPDVLVTEDGRMFFRATEHIKIARLADSLEAASIEL